MTAPMDSSLDFNTSAEDESRPRVGMASLVDIVLLLICFYLLVMRSIQSNVDERVELPEVRNDQAVEIHAAELVVNLTADGRTILNGAEMDDETLRQILHVEHGRAAAERRQLTVVVRADASRRYGDLDDVQAACRAAGFESITLRALEGDGS